MIRPRLNEDDTPWSERPFGKALVIGNPIAGRGRGTDAAREACDGLRSLGIATDLFMTQERRDALRRVRTMDADTELVVSVGGDGTLSEVLGGLVNRDVPVAQLPLGTANVLAQELGLPRDVDGLLDVVRRRRTSTLDTAVVDGRLTFLCVGSGIDGSAVAEVEARRTGPISYLSYVKAMARVLRNYRPPRLKLEIDGEPIAGEFGFVLVSNVREYGGFFHLSSKCRRDDARVEVYAARSGTVSPTRSTATSAGTAASPTKSATRATRSWSPEPVQASRGGPGRWARAKLSAKTARAITSATPTTGSTHAGSS
ncbi:MAG: diacylglycerol/lipid kinase family protein [Planctomycetota bacterium]|jgi:diacylglycerol kinase family enzyme